MTAKRNGGDGALAEHLKRNYNSPKEIYKVYEKFSTLNIPLYISEITVATRDTGLGVELGEKIQADIIEDLYRLWFSIPKMEGIIFWNLVDGHAFGGESSCLGCLLDEKYYEKPSYQRLYQLINREWKTNINGSTDGNGCIDFRGFHGDYLVTICNDDGSENKFEFFVHEGKENSRTCTI